MFESVVAGMRLRFGDNPANIVEAIGSSIASQERTIDQLREAARVRSFGGVRESAHHFKTPAGYLYLSQVELLSRDVEALAIAKEELAFVRAVQLADEMAVVNEAMKRYGAMLQAPERDAP